MAVFHVRQVIKQTLVYIVDDAKDAADAISQVNGGLVPIAYEVDGDTISTTAEEAGSEDKP